MKNMISVADAADVLGISPRQVLRLIAAKLLVAEKIGGGYVIRRADLAKVPKDRKPGPKGKKGK